jgi:hypothetical protein
VGTVNVGSRAPTCLPFIVVLRERGSTAIRGKRPRSGRGSDWFPNSEITFLTPGCTFPCGISSPTKVWEQRKDYPRENLEIIENC